MAQRKRPQRVKAPPVPSGEAPAVTIANQDRQIKLLIDRLSKLGDELTESKAQRDAVESAYGSASEMLATLTHRVAESDIAYARLQGWQDCAREMLEKRS